MVMALHVESELLFLIFFGNSLICLSTNSTGQMLYTVIPGSAAEDSRIATTLTCDQERMAIQNCAEECFQMAENGTGCPGFYANKDGIGPCYMCHVSNIQNVQNANYTTFTGNHFLYMRTHNKTEPEVEMDFEDFFSENKTIKGKNVNGTANDIAESDHVTGIKGKGIYINNGANISLTGSEHECWTNIEHCTDGLTFSIWINAESVTAAYVVGSGAIKQRGVNFYLDNRFYMMTSLDTERFNAFSHSMASVNTWYLFTGAYHPMKVNSVYVNGILEAENQFTARASNPAVHQNWRATIGSRDSSQYNIHPFRGTVDEFKYYYTILNPMGLYFNN